MRLYREESFGPVVTVLPVDGIVHDDPQLPFGWRAALEEFTELRWITVGGPEGRHYPI